MPVILGLSGVRRFRSPKPVILSYIMRLGHTRPCLKGENKTKQFRVGKSDLMIHACTLENGELKASLGYIVGHKNREAGRCVW